MVDPKSVVCIYKVKSDIVSDNFVPDNVPGEAPLKWAPGIVTWKLVNETGDIPDGEMVHTAFALAFTHWGLFTKDISFHRVYGDVKADITIKFVVDPSTFASASTLAMTYYPNPNNPSITSLFNNDMHLIWSLDGKPITCAQALKQGNAIGCVDPNELLQTINLLQVALHEMGHAIGLVHTNDCPKCTMYPFYHNDMELQPQEISIVQQMYGKRIIPQWVIDNFTSVLNRIKNLGRYI